MTANRDLETPEDVTAARVSLGKQLAAWRSQARITQRDLARRIGYSRSAVASAESGAPSSAGFWRAADPVVDANGALIAQHARIDAAVTAARRRAARLAWVARTVTAEPPITDAPEPGAVVALDGTCPHCSKPVAIPIRVSAALTPQIGW